MPKNYKKQCPKCKSPNYVVSVFGSICSECGYQDTENSNFEKIKHKVGPESDWENKILKMRGYNIQSGEAFIVLEDKNEIWKSKDLLLYIKDLLKSQQKRLSVSEWQKIGKDKGYFDYYEKVYRERIKKEIIEHLNKKYFVGSDIIDNIIKIINK